MCARYFTVKGKGKTNQWNKSIKLLVSIFILLFSLHLTISYQLLLLLDYLIPSDAHFWSARSSYYVLLLSFRLRQRRRWWWLSLLLHSLKFNSSFHAHFSFSYLLFFTFSYQFSRLLFDFATFKRSAIRTCFPRTQLSRIGLFVNYLSEWVSGMCWILCSIEKSKSKEKRSANNNQSDLVINFLDK